MTIRTAVVVGNPRARSRTRTTAELVAEELADAPAEVVIDLADWGSALLDPDDRAVCAAVEEVRASGLVVFASPTYKAACTGLLKLFLDRFPSDGLRGTVAVPLMLGAAPTHALAPETSLRPVLSELGAAVPTRGLYVLDSQYDDPTAWSAWVEGARPHVLALLTASTGATR